MRSTMLALNTDCRVSSLYFKHKATKRSNIMHVVQPSSKSFSTTLPVRPTSIKGPLAESSSLLFFTASTTAPRRPRNEFDLPQDDYAQLHLVTGGKWLVTLTTEGTLKVWDLEPYHHIASRPSGSKASGYGIDKPPPMLCGEGRFAARSTLMDARLSDDSAQLLTFLHHPRNDYGEEL